MRIPRLLALLLAVSFYTGIGAILVVADPVARAASLVLVLVAGGFAVARSVLAVAVGVAVITFGIDVATGGVTADATLTALGWSAAAGSVVGSLRLYDRVFEGADWASTCLVLRARSRPAAARLAFFTFKIVPELQLRLRRVARAQRVLGPRRSPERFGLVSWLVDTLVSYFLECLEVLFSLERVLARRSAILVAVARGRRQLELRLLAVLILHPAMVVGVVATT